MKTVKAILAVILATAWISISEFLRNQFFLKSYWTGHYTKLGLVFPSEPVNGVIWGVWALVFAILILILSRKFSLTGTVLFSWVMGFILMWLVIGNLSVLPFGTLVFAVPWSLVELFIATVIVRQFREKD
ncbi:MAG TPA: hypothetical protein VMT63_08890 [Bacteroidales bacterium]|nr:hypothetical protein [Bacteroidales bacterium]